MPCFILCLYGLAFLNKAGIHALDYTKDTKYPAGEIELDANGVPTGLLIAKPSALILYSTLALLPRLNKEQQENSTVWFYREMNRFGLTSAIDPGGGGQGIICSYMPTLSWSSVLHTHTRHTHCAYIHTPTFELTHAPAPANTRGRLNPLTRNHATLHYLTAAGMNLTEV